MGAAREAGPKLGRPPFSGRACRFGLALLARVLAGCLSGNYSVAPPPGGQDRDERPHVGKAAANFPEAAPEGAAAPAGASEGRPKGATGPPPPRTLPQAVRAYLRSLHESLPEPKKDGDGTSPKEDTKKDASNGEDKRGKEKGAAAQQQQGEGKVGKNDGKGKQDEDKGDKDNGKEKDGAGNGKDKSDGGPPTRTRRRPRRRGSAPTPRPRWSRNPTTSSAPCTPGRTAWCPCRRGAPPPPRRCSSPPGCGSAGTTPASWCSTPRWPAAPGSAT
jgi:hypothetical protein